LVLLSSPADALSKRAPPKEVRLRKVQKTNKVFGDKELKELRKKVEPKPDKENVKSIKQRNLTTFITVRCAIFLAKNSTRRWKDYQKVQEPGGRRQRGHFGTISVASLHHRRLFCRLRRISVFEQLGYDHCPMLRVSQ